MILCCWAVTALISSWMMFLLSLVNKCVAFFLLVSLCQFVPVDLHRVVVTGEFPFTPTHGWICSWGLGTRLRTMDSIIIHLVPLVLSCDYLRGQKRTGNKFMLAFRACQMQVGMEKLRGKHCDQQPERIKPRLGAVWSPVASKPQHVLVSNTQHSTFQIPEEFSCFS